MKPLLSYYGGKQRLVSKLLPLIPPHTCYVEPFAGGASLMFAKGRPGGTHSNSYVEILSDTYAHVTHLYETVKKYPEEFFAELDTLPYSSHVYRRARDICYGKIEADDVQKAVSFYVSVNWSFANKAFGGFGFGKVSNLASRALNKRHRVLEQIEYLSLVTILDKDAIEVIKLFDSPTTFFYCDPPYPDTEQGHYEGYTIEDFQELVDALSEIEGSFMLSNYPQEVSFPEHWERFEFDTVMTASRDKKVDIKRTEVVWRKVSKDAVGWTPAPMEDYAQVRMFA